MADVFTRKKRSEVMSKIRGRGNLSTEMRMIALMREAKLIGWRRNHRLPGRPDFVFGKQRLAIFIDGCFWHGCPLHYREPTTRQKFWQLKISQNKIRDRRVNRILKTKGWRVMRVWEHELRRHSAPSTIKRLRRLLKLEKNLS